MYIVIAGAGRVGGRLARDLADLGHDVVVIDHSPRALEDLGVSFNGIALDGLAYDVDVLAEARVEQADIFCAMTDDDNTNLMAVEVVKAVYGVERVVARLDDPARERSYEALGIPYISTTKLISAVAMERVLSEEFDIHVAFEGGKIEVVEFTIGSGANGMTVSSFEVDGALRVAAIRRNGATFVPGESTELKANDLVVAAVHHGVRSDIEPLLAEDQ